MRPVGPRACGAGGGLFGAGVRPVGPRAGGARGGLFGLAREDLDFAHVSGRASARA